MIYTSPEGKKIVVVRDERGNFTLETTGKLPEMLEGTFTNYLEVDKTINLYFAQEKQKPTRLSKEDAKNIE